MNPEKPVAMESSPGREISDPLEALQVLFPAGAFTEEEIREIVPLCAIQSFAAGSILITEGEPSDNRIYFILKGSVSVYIQDRFILRLSNFGDTIGEMGLISSAPRSATVKANESSSFLIVNAALHSGEEDSKNYKFRYFLSRIFSTILTEKLRHTSDRAKLYEDMATKSKGLEKERGLMEKEISTYLQQISLFTHLVNSAKDTILISDTAGKILLANPSLKESFGIETEQAMGMEIPLLFGLRDQGETSWDSITAAAGDGGWNGELMLHHPSQGEIPADCSVSTVYDEEGNLLAYSVILRDIRERKALEEKMRRQREELEEMYRKLKELDRAKSNFLNIVSHELRTPITNISAYSELLSTEGMVEPEDQAEFIAIIHHEAEKLNEMVKKVLAMAKMESGEMLFNFSENMPEEMLQKMIAAYREKSREKGMELNFYPEPSLHPIVYDEENLRVAIDQVLENAVNYSEADTINIRLSQNNDRTLIVIEDTGKGIDGQGVGELLEKFGRGDDVNIGHHGLGLGLPLCYLIVKAHSGVMKIDSEIGRGTTVSIDLPSRRQAETVNS